MSTNHVNIALATRVFPSSCAEGLADEWTEIL